MQMEFPPYEAPILTVDAVVFEITNNELQVLLIRRNREPFEGGLALPGGYNPRGETTLDALNRVLARKTGISTDSLVHIEQLYTFDTIARDPRGHAVSITYMGLGRDLHAGQSETTEDPAFYPVRKLPRLAFDHQHIIKYALERLASRVAHTNTMQALLPPLFTLTQLQLAYEAVLDKQLDKRNFRKKFLELGAIEATDELLKEGAHRPARLYKFVSQDILPLSQTLD